jgi:hypothetical protein
MIWLLAPLTLDRTSTHSCLIVRCHWQLQDTMTRPNSQEPLEEK